MTSAKIMMLRIIVSYVKPELLRKALFCILSV